MMRYCDCVGIRYIDTLVARSVQSDLVVMICRDTFKFLNNFEKLTIKRQPVQLNVFDGNRDDDGVQCVFVRFAVDNDQNKL